MRNQEKAEAVCEQCRSLYGVKALPYRCNVASLEEVKDTVSRINKDLGNVGILVNNAGITRDGLIMSMKEEDFDAVIDTNLKGAFHFIRQCSLLFIRGRFGRIINMSSVSGLAGNAGQGNYSASKAGLLGLTKSVARELAPKGITCNAVAPGFIETDMTRDLMEKQNDIISAIPLKRAGKPEDVAQAVAFLACSDYITGEVIRVDGGMAM